MHLVKIFTDTLLRSLLIDQVDESAILIISFDVFIVFLGEIAVEFVVRMDGDSWTPFKIRSLLPNDRDRPSELHVRKEMALSIDFSVEDHLSLSCIRSISIQIASSRDPPLSLPSPIPSRYQDQFAGVAGSSLDKVIADVSRDEPSDPFVGFHLQEIIDPICVVHIRLPFILYRCP